MDLARHSFFDAVDEATMRRRRGAKWARYGDEALAAWVADMDFAPAPPIRAALAELVESGDLGYPWLGEPNVVAEAFAGWAARRYQWSVDPARIVLSGDVLQPLVAVIDLCSAPGDGVIIQTPIYPPFLMSLEMTGRVLVDNPLGPASEGYRLDVPGLRAAVAASLRADRGRARILLLCHPHNPTGRVFDDGELAALAEVVVDADLTVISDEIHADLVFPGVRHRPFASLGPEVAARTVTLTSATKSFSIAGLRLALAHFGSSELQERYASIPRFLLGGANSAGVAATLAAWREGDAWIDELVRYLDGNRQLVARTVDERLPGVSHRRPEATYLAWLDCRRLVTDGRGPNPAQFFLDHARVALNDGADFGHHGVGFTRLNFATSLAMLERILDQMAAALGDPARRS
jgi:cysteine-S-conjugate beta-lyase